MEIERAQAAGAMIGEPVNGEDGAVDVFNERALMPLIALLERVQAEWSVLRRVDSTAQIG